VHVSCSRCYEPRRIAFADDRLLARPFAGTRFCCAKTRRNGETGGGLGTVYVRPTEMLQVGGPVSLPSCSAEDACRTGRSTRSSSTSHHGRTQTCSAATASVARGVEGRSRGTYTGRLGGRPMAVPPRHPPGAQHTKWWNSVAVYPLPQHGNIGGRNGSCRTAVAFGYSHSHSLAHVGAGLAALGAEPTRLRDSACFQIIRSAWSELLPQVHAPTRPRGQGPPGSVLPFSGAGLSFVGMRVSQFRGCNAPIRQRPKFTEVTWDRKWSEDGQSHPAIAAAT
jgi:hypothetical protein